MKMHYQTYSYFKYWYKYARHAEYHILDKKTFQVIGKVDKHNNILGIPDLDDPRMLPEVELQSEFGEFVIRPEYKVGHKIDINGMKIDDAIEQFDELLQGICMIRAQKIGKDPDEQDDYIEKITTWLHSTDFYDAPASTIYHEAFKHGLLYHTISVYNNMLDLIQIPKFSKVDLDSAALCCIAHDWCKINLYESYKRNVKNEQTGVWEKVDSYRRGTFDHPFGHGAASMWMAMKMFKLTEEEALAIRWHMGRYNVSENEVNEFQLANETYPLVHLLQFADQLSITEY